MGQALDKICKPARTIRSSRVCATERQLIAAAKKGEELAFESLFKRHQRKIFAIALRYTQVREDAEDVVQETFQKAFVHFHNFEEKSSFSTWATRIAINQDLMLLRRRRALSEVSIDHSSSHEETSPALELADAGPDPETTYVQKEEAEILSAAIGRLGLETRAAIELQGLGELSNQTAERMGISVGAVKARLFHARRKLNETLRRHMRPRRTFRTAFRL